MHTPERLLTRPYIERGSRITDGLLLSFQQFEEAGFLIEMRFVSSTCFARTLSAQIVLSHFGPSWN